MKRKYGFTLIELLAVIVVLGIIALIATPIVLNLIESSRKGAAEQSTISYVKAIENETMLSILDEKKYADKEDYVYDEINVSVNGIYPTGGLYSLKNSTVTNGVFCVNGYEVEYSENKAVAKGKCTGEDLKLNGSIKLSETSGYYTYPNSGTIEVVQNISGGTLTCTSSDENVAKCSISGTTVTVTPGTKEGAATLTIISKRTSKYKEAQTAYVATTKKGLLSYTATEYNGIYDGEPHGITVESSGAIITYGEVEGVYNKEISPTRTDAGTTTVYYQITKVGYTTVTGSKDIVIEKAEGEIELEETAGEIQYNEIKEVEIIENKSNGNLIVEVSDTSIVEVSIENNKLVIKGKKLGTATITVISEETSNYNRTTKEYTVKVIKANNTLTLSSSSGTYTYPESGTFEVTENTSGGTLSCETSNSSVATCEVTGTTVTVKPGTTEGITTLTVKSAATTNYNEGQASHVAITAKGVLTNVTATGYEGAYDGALHGITVTASGTTITYSTDGINYSSTNPTYTNVGTYTVYYQVTKEGYETVTGSKQVVINDETAPTWSVTTSTNNMLTTDTITINIIGTDNETGVKSYSLTKDKIKLLVNGVEIAPLKATLSTPRIENDKVIYSYVAEIITLSGSLSLQIEENTLYDLADNNSEAQTISTGVNISKNSIPKILVWSDYFGYYYQFLDRSYSNITMDTTLSADQIIAGGYNVVVYDGIWGGAREDLNTLFDNGINIISIGDDTGSGLSIINDAIGVNEYPQSGFVIYKKVNNNFTKYLAEYYWHDGGNQSLVYFKSGVDVLFNIDFNGVQYDAMGYYNSGRSRWLHVQNYQIMLQNSDVIVPAVEYVLGNI